MSESPAERGRLLPFEPDRGKRYHFRKYVEGILWRGISETERERRILETMSRRDPNPTVPPDSPRTTCGSPFTTPRILRFRSPLVGNDRLLADHLMEVLKRKSREKRELEQARTRDGEAAALEPLDTLKGESPATPE